MESSAFSIASIAKIFHLLIDDLYENKVQSITREIWSNALDAHVEAGCADRPFEITLPSALAPTFRVRDYGVSMTHEMVMGLYASLGFSTKDGGDIAVDTDEIAAVDADELIGKFGIGSKSPFAYTDTFNVTVVLNGVRRFYFNGVRRFYSAIIDPKGVPGIHLMGDETTTDEDGVEISFPVHEADIRAFRIAAQRVSLGFAVKPIVENSAEFEGWTELDIAATGSGWTLLRNAPDGGRRVAYAKMGPVLYPINSSAIEGLDYNERDFLGYPIILDFNIGDLDVAASRETLAYGRDKPTIGSITERTRTAIAEMTETVLATYPECDTYWDACLKMSRDISSGLPTSVTKNVTARAKWGGRKLVTIIEAKLRGTGIGGCVLDGKKLRNKVYRFKNIDWHEKLNISVSDGTLIVIEDTTIDKPVKRMSDRIRQYREDTTRDVKSVVWFKYHGGRAASEFMDGLFNSIDGAHIVMAHDLPVPARGTNPYGGNYTPVQARILDGYSYANRITLSAEQHEEGGYFFQMERGEPITYYNVGALVDALKRLGAIDEDTLVLGIPKTLWKRFAGDQWTEVTAFGEEVYAEEADGMEEAVSAHEDNRRVLNNDLLQFLAKNINSESLPVGSSIREAVAFRHGQIVRHHKQQRTVDVTGVVPVMTLGNVLSKEIETHQTDVGVELDLHVELIEETYPLLPALADNWSFNNLQNSVDLLTDYVIMCDTMKKPNQAALAA
jgi:hypothetical protein